MLKALGFKKDIPEEQRDKYKELKCACGKWQSDVDALRTVSEELRTAYETHKGDCALGRYQALKVMIKEARSRYQTVTEKKGPEVTPGSRGKLGGLLQGLKAFAAQSSDIAEEEGTIANMSRKEMTAELDRLKELLDKTKRACRLLKDTFDKLDNDYENSKRQLPHQRYYTMKDMVKVVIRTKTRSI